MLQYREVPRILRGGTGRKPLVNAQERRAQIVEKLKGAGAPVSASALAQSLGVSRQIVVGDVALLRAQGTPVAATPRGYVLREEREEGLRVTIACRHDAQGIRDELYAIVDAGCGVLNVIVEHAVYGQISGELQVFCRYDADRFCDALFASQAEPLCSLTGDIHLHTLLCPDEARRDAALGALRALGILQE